MSNVFTRWGIQQSFGVVKNTSLNVPKCLEAGECDLSIPATSALAERGFSAATNIVNKE